jgi:adenylosuccinate lyase
MQQQNFLNENLEDKTYSLVTTTTTTMEKRESQARQKWKREIRKKERESWRKGRLTKHENLSNRGKRAMTSLLQSLKCKLPKRKFL